jgi:hypothetical protein
MRLDKITVGIENGLGHKMHVEQYVQECDASKDYLKNQKLASKNKLYRYDSKLF